METLFDVMRALAHACRGFLAEHDLTRIREIIDEHDPAVAEAQRVAEQTMTDAEHATLADLLQKAERIQAAQSAPAAPAAQGPAVHGFPVASPAAPAAPPAEQPPDPNFLQPRAVVANPPAGTGG